MRSVFVKRPLRRPAWLLIWLPALLMTIAIAFESTSTFSAHNTSSFLRPIVERLVGPLRDSTWESVHHLFRKSGHFGGYGFLCLMYLRGWLLTFSQKAWSLGRWRLRGCGLAVASTFAVASLDEWHQTFLPSRTGLFSDVLLDTSGGLVMCGLAWLLLFRRSREL